MANLRFADFFPWLTKILSETPKKKRSDRGSFVSLARKVSQMWAGEGSISFFVMDIIYLFIDIELLWKI